MTGIRDRMLFSRLLFGTFVLSLVYTASNFAAPFMIAPGAAVDLDGSANAIDNSDLYRTFSFYPMVIYTVGDAQCHQIQQRTIMLNGNEMPMDARMTSIYLWANLGLLTAMFSTPSTSVAQGLVNALPKRIQAWTRAHLGPALSAALLVGLCLLPVAADGFSQLLFPYESTNLKRFLTGIPAGWAGGLLVGVLMTSIRQVDLEVRALRGRLPA